MAPTLNNGEFVIILNQGVLNAYYNLIKNDNSNYTYRDGDVVVFGMPTVFEKGIVKFTKMIKRVEKNFNNQLFSNKYWLVPQKGDSVSVNENNYEELKTLILYDRYNMVSKKFSEIKENQTYRFDNNFYFLIGDNVESSMDSREYGPIPEAFIYGKILYSFN